MLVQEDLDAPHIIRVARGVPARLIDARTPFGISHAPTRGGRVSFTLCGTTQGMTGHVSIIPNLGQQPSPSTNAGWQRLLSIRVGKPGTNVSLHAHGATIVHIDHAEGSALFRCGLGVVGFNFTARTIS
eukprot:COSAG05_NODE_793_length_7295_cov_2.666481_2_plen_129_part_00